MPEEWWKERSDDFLVTTAAAADPGAGTRALVIATLRLRDALVAQQNSTNRLTTVILVATIAMLVIGGLQLGLQVYQPAGRPAPAAPERPPAAGWDRPPTPPATPAPAEP
jgi:hypothetical protein